MAMYDWVYTGLVFGSIGVSSTAVLHLQQHPSFSQLQEPITASFIVLSMGAWLLLATFLYKLYALIKGLVCRRDGRTLREEEMVILMDVMDGKEDAGDDDSVLHTPPAVSQLPQSYNGALRVLKVRNDLIVNIYLVATGLSCSVFALAVLDARAGAFFCSGVMSLAGRDFFLRCKILPEFYDSVNTLTRHRWLQSGEFIVYCCVTVAVVFIGAVSPVLPSTYVYPAHDLVIHCISFLSPFLLSVSPPEHHYLVALETSIPFSALIAVCVLYMLSPIAPYVQEAARIDKGWLLFQLVPLVMPATVIGIMHCIRRGMTLVVGLSLAFWIMLHVALTGSIREHHGLSTAAITLLATAWVVGGYIVYYRYKYVASHVIYKNATPRYMPPPHDLRFSIGTPDEE